MPDNKFMQNQNQSLPAPTQRLEDVKEVKDSWVAPKLGTAEQQRNDFNARASESIADSVFENINRENEQKLAQGLIARADANPARYLHAVKTADALGFKDYDLVYDNLDEFEKHRKEQEKERHIRYCNNLADMCIDDPTLLAKLDDVSAAQLARINDNMVIYGRAEGKTGISGRLARAKYTFDRAEQDFETNELAYDLIGTSGAERAEKLRLLQEAEAKLEDMPELDTSGWSIGDLTLNAVEQLPYQIRTTGAMAAGTVGGAVAGLAASPAGAVVAGYAGNIAGRAAALYNGYKAESGSMARELLRMKDEDDKPLDDDIVDVASRFYGVFSSAIEQIGAEGMFKALGLGNITKMGLKSAIKEAIKDKTKREIFVKIAKDFTGAITSDGAEEFMQQLLQSGVERTAKDFARMYRGDNYEADDFVDGLIEDFAEAGEAGIQGAKASIVMAGVPTAARAGYATIRQQRALHSRVKETKAKADMQILDNTQKQVQAYAESPAFEPKTLNALFQRTRRQSIYQDIFVSVEDAKALMLSEAMQKNKEALTKNGLWADMERQISEGETLGTPVRIGFADFGEKVMPSPELYAAWKDVVKTYEDGVTLKEIREKEQRRANWLVEGQKRAARKDADFEYAYKMVLENSAYAGISDQQRREQAELAAGLMCYMAEQSNTNIQEFVNRYAPQFEVSLNGEVGSDANVQGIIQAVRDEAINNETKNLINVSKRIARKDINAIKKLLLSKIDNPNTADVKKYVQIVNAISDMKLNIEGMSDEDIINHLAEYTKSGELKLDIKRDDADRAKSGLYSASETALADIQATTGGGDYVLVGGGRVPVNYEIVELNDMVTSHDDAGAVNANYPQELQPRDRSRSASDMQIVNIVNNFAPERVARAEIATEGAPIVTKEGFVAVGNGRAMAIRQVYNNEPAAQRYKDYLTAKGFDLTGFSRPVLVRRLTMDMNSEQLKALVDDANTSGTMQYSDSENALRDAAKMSGNLIDLLDIDADIDSAANKRFLNGFFAEVVPTAERNAYLDKDDKITRKGVERVENALVAKLLPDARFLSVLVENPDNNIRKVTKSLAKAAPAIIGFENDIAAGRVNADYSIAADVAGAVEVLKRAKDKGVSATDFIKMTDMFESPISSSTQAMVQLFENTSGATDFLNKMLNYIHNASDQGDLEQGSMFATEPMTKLQLLEMVNAQGALFQLPQEALDITEKISRIDAERLAFERKDINPELKGRENEKVKAVEINRFFADRKSSKEISIDEVMAAVDANVGKNKNGVRVLKNSVTGETATLSNSAISKMFDTTRSRQDGNIGGILGKECIANIGRIFDTALLIKTTPDAKHGTKNRIRRYANAIVSDGETFMVKITVKEMANKRLELTDIEIENNGGTDLAAYDLKVGRKNTAVDAFGNLTADKSAVSSGNNISIDDLIKFVNTYAAETIQIDGKEKAVRNSAGERIARTEEGLRAFYEWFGDSKAVDENGRPLVVYHGTGADFDTFDVSKSGKNTGNKGFYGDGIYLTDKDSEAKFYAQQSVIDRFSSRIFGNMSYDKAQQFIKDKSIIMPLYVSLKNPFMWNGITTEEEAKAISRKIGMKLEWNEKYKQINHFRDDKKSVKFSEKLKQAGYDGVIYKGDNGREIVVFEPNQIKSVYNRGNFSRTTDNIYYQTGKTDRNLVVQHATTLEKLSEALELGAMPMPSLAVTKSEYAGDSNFGEIVFIGGSDVIDPAKNRDNHTFSADIYSTRKISPVHEINQDGREYLERLTGAMSKKGLNYWIENVKQNLDYGNNSVLKVLFLASKSKITDLDGSTYMRIQDMSEQEKSDFAKWKRKFVAEYTDKKIFEGFTPSGNRRFSPYDLNNVLRLMKKENLKASESTAGGNAHALRGLWADELKSIEEIRQAKGKIVDAETYKNLDNAIWDETTKLSDLLVTEQKAEELERSWIAPDEYMIEEVLKKLKPNSNIKVALEKAELRSDKKAVDAVKRYMELLKATPVQYFESKLQRAVEFSEFAGVIMPTSQEYDSIADTMAEYGLRVVRSDDKQAAVKEFEDVFFQEVGTDALGAYIPLERKIVLFRGHNLSTIIHETGHWWLDVLSQVAQTDKASDKLRQDWATIKDWLGVSDDNIISTEQHEKFARGVEAYFMTRKAPSLRLAQLFDTFRRWLAGVYKDVKELDVDLNDDVVRVFDHMLASEAEIEEYRQANRLKEMFDRADTFGMSDKDFEKYREMAESSLTLAQNKHFNDKMLLIYREEQEAYAKEKERLAALVRNEWCEDKYNRALYAIYRGKVGDIEIGEITLNEAEMHDLFGDDLTGLPKRDGKAIYAADGMDLQTVADFVGLTPGELKGTLLSARKRVRKYKEMLDRRTHEELGDPVSYDDVQKQVVASIYNDKQASLLRFELNTIGKSLGRKSVLEQAYDAYARHKIENMTIKDLKPQAYAEQAQRAGDKALQAMERGNRNEAYRQKEIQIRNFYLYREAQKQLDAVEKAVKRLKQIGKKEVNTGVDQTYQDAARALLSKVDLARALNSKQKERLGNLAMWVMEQRQNGYEIVVPDKFLHEINRVNYTELTVDDFLSLTDSVKSLIHNGRAIKEFELAGQLVDREALLAEMNKSLKKFGRLPKSRSSRKTFGETAAKFWRGMDSFLTGLGYLANRVDGGDTNGVFHKTFVRPLSEAQTLENDLKVKYANKIADLTAGLSKETKAKMRDYVPEAEQRLGGKYTLEDLITIGLNMGNKDNLQRLKDGNGFSDNQLNWVKNYLTQEHWDYIQAIWDVLESMYPMLEEHHKKMSGLDMDKVFPIPVQTNYGQYRGGYFPIVYDREFSPDMEAKAALYDADYNVATTSKGYTKQRLNKVNAPIKLGLMNVAQHINTVLHDVAYRGTLRKLWTLANNAEFVEMFDNSIGKEYREGINDLLKMLGNEPNRETRGLAAWEKCLQFIRRRATLIGLGFRITTALSQPLGFFSSIATMTEHKQKQGGQHGGAYYIALSHKELMTNPKLYDWARACSGELRARLGNQDASIAKRIKELTKNAGNMTFKEQAETWAYKAIGYMDYYVSTVTWVAAYRQATTDFKMNHEDAVFYADRVMLNSQGTGSTKDTAAIQRANEGWRALTMFYSFFSALYQTSVQMARDVKTAKTFKEYADLSARFMAMFVLPSCLDSLMRGEAPDGDDESYIAWLFDNVFGYFIGGVPILRDVYSGLKYHNSGSSNVGRQVNYFGNFANAIGKAFDGDPNWQKISKNALNSFAVVTGYPTGGQIADTASYFVGVAAGEIEPHSMADILWGIYKGKERE